MMERSEYPLAPGFDCSRGAEEDRKTHLSLCALYVEHFNPRIVKYSRGFWTISPFRRYNRTRAEHGRGRGPGGKATILDTKIHTEAPMVRAWQLMAAIYVAEAEAESSLPRNVRFLWAMLPLVLALLLAAVLVAAFKHWQQKQSGPVKPGVSDQLAHFRALYERGELSEGEFARIRELLGERLKKEMEIPAGDYKSAASTDQPAQSTRPPQEELPAPTDLPKSDAIRNRLPDDD